MKHSNLYFGLVLPSGGWQSLIVYDSNSSLKSDIEATHSALMERRTLKNVNNCLNSKIYFYLETSGGKSYNLYLNVVHLSTPVLIRHLWQLTTVVFHWCLMHAALLKL
jgi:hypothetical protein